MNAPPSELPATSGEPTSVVREPTLRLIVLLGALTTFSPLAIDMYLPAFPEIARDLDAPAGAVQLTLSLFLAGLALGQLVIGPISDRLGRRPPLLAGCLGFAAAAVLCSLARSIEGLIAARFLMGLSGAAGLVTVRAVVRDLFDERSSARIYSMIMLVVGLAPVLAPSLGSWLLTAWDWHAIFWVLAVAGIGCGVAAAVDLRESLPSERRSRDSFASLPARYAAMLRDRRFLGYAMAGGFGAGMLFAYVSGSSFAFLTHFGVSKGAFGVLFASNAIGLFGAAQVNRRLLNRYDSRSILRVASAVNAAAGLALLVVSICGFGGIPAFFAPLFVCLATLGLILPNTTAAAMARFGRRAGGASALLGMLQYAIGAAAGAAVGLLDDGTIVPMAEVVAAAGVCVALTCFAAARDGG